MATFIKSGPMVWSGERDDEGYRSYKVKWLIVSNDTEDGPFTVMRTPGLPLPGTLWQFGNDNDPWAYCTLESKFEHHQGKEGDPHRYWAVEQNFTTKPKLKCAEYEVEDPLQEPPKISGTFSKYTKSGTHDRFGAPIANSAHEPIEGEKNEWDKSKMTVKIEQNVAILNLPLLALMDNTVNAFPLWGCQSRSIKLTVGQWSQEYHGACYVYFKRSLEFEFEFPTWDRDIRDVGTKVLSGQWNDEGEWEDLPIGGGDPDPDGRPPNPDPRNPAHFIKFSDRQARETTVVLDGTGRPYQETPQVIFDNCIPCADIGVPISWVAEGFDLVNVNEAGFHGTILTYIGPCQWGGIVGDTYIDQATAETIPNPLAGLVMRLNYIGEVPGLPAHWELTSDHPNGRLWTKPASEFNCLGNNTLFRFNPNAPGGIDPEETVYLTPLIFPTTLPGVIHVEYYNESNFYLLGIPTVF